MPRGRGLLPQAERRASNRASHASGDWGTLDKDRQSNKGLEANSPTSRRTLWKFHLSPLGRDSIARRYWTSSSLTTHESPACSSASRLLWVHFRYHTPSSHRSHRQFRKRNPSPRPQTIATRVLIGVPANKTWGQRSTKSNRCLQRLHSWSSSLQGAPLWDPWRLEKGAIRLCCQRVGPPGLQLGGWKLKAHAKRLSSD